MSVEYMRINPIRALLARFLGSISYIAFLIAEVILFYIIVCEQGSVHVADSWSIHYRSYFCGFTGMWNLGPGGVLPYMGYIGMCGPKGYVFQPFRS